MKFYSVSAVTSHVACADCLGTYLGTIAKHAPSIGSHALVIRVWHVPKTETDYDSERCVVCRKQAFPRD